MRFLARQFQRRQSSPTSASSNGAASSSDAAVYTTAELRIRIHEEKLRLELEELADEIIERQIARLVFDRELRANCMASVDQAVQAYKLLRDIKKRARSTICFVSGNANYRLLIMLLDEKEGPQFSDARL